MPGTLLTRCEPLNGFAADRQVHAAARPERPAPRSRRVPISHRDCEKIGFSGATGGSYAAYSDDGGDSWIAGAGTLPGNENQIVELRDGSLLMNMRNGVHPRFARSFDGGETWTAPVAQPQLLQPAAGVMTSILRFPRPGRGLGHSVLVYSSPNSTNFRAAGRIHVSCDEGAAWTPGKLFYPGKFGYSVMTVLDDGSLGVFFERSRTEGFSVDVEHLSFVRLSRGWLSSEHGRCVARPRGNRPQD